MTLSLFLSLLLLPWLLSCRSQADLQKCTDTNSFFLFKRAATFNQSKDGCKRQGGTLARIANEGEFNEVQKLVSDTNGVTELWIGNTSGLFDLCH